MGFIIKNKKRKINVVQKLDRKWKEENKLYLEELQRFFDRVDNIEDNELKRSVVSQMMICDKILTEIAEDMFMNFYDEGYKSGKEG